MKRLTFWLIDHPLLGTVAILVLSGYFASHVPRLETDSSIEAFMRQKDPDRDYYERMRSKFGSDEVTVVVVETKDVFETEVLRVIKRLSHGIAKLGSVSRVDSLTTVKNLKGRGDWLDTDLLVGGEVPADTASLERVRREVMENPIFLGHIVSEDMQAAAIVIYTDFGFGNPDFERQFVLNLERLIQRESKPGMRIYQIGGPFHRATLEAHIAEDQRTTTVVGLLAVLVLLYLTFRRAYAVVIPVAIGVLSIVWTLGWMVILGYPLNMLTAIIPALVLCIGLTEDIHMISEYNRALVHSKDRLTAVRTMMDIMVRPLWATSLTSALGFASMAVTGITMMVQFSHVAPLGLMSNFVITIVLLPAVLRYWPVSSQHSLGHGPTRQHARLDGFLHNLGEFNIRHRTPIVCGLFLLITMSLLGMSRLRADSDFVKNFKEGSLIRERMERLHAVLSGANLFYLVVESGRADGVKEPELLRGIQRLQDFVTGLGPVDKTLSVVDFIRKMHLEVHNGDHRFDVVPSSRDLVAQYLLLLDGKEVSKFVDYSYSTANILVRHNVTSSHELKRLLRTIEDYAVGNLPLSSSVRYTGQEILIHNTADSMAVNTIMGVMIVLIAVMILSAALFLSLTAGVLSLIPNILPIGISFGLMGYFDIPISITTALIAPIAVGVVVDDTIHYMVRNHWELNNHFDRRIAMFNTLRSEGQAILVTSLVLIGGFSATSFSNFQSTMYFGIFGSIVIISALIVDLTLTPILMYSTRLVTLGDMFLKRIDKDVLNFAQVFLTMTRWQMRKLLLFASLRCIEPGEYVIRRGQAERALYIVIKGQLRVLITQNGQEHVLDVLQPGDVFGEVALVDQRERSADVVALEPGELLRIEPELIDQLRRRFPRVGLKLYQNLSIILATRLRRQTAKALPESSPKAERATLGDSNTS